MTYVEQKRFNRKVRRALSALRDFDQATGAFLMHTTTSHLSHKSLSDALDRWEAEATARKKEVRSLWLDVYWIPAEPKTRSTLKLEALDRSISALIRAVRHHITFLQSIAELRYTIVSKARK
jgi:hypothetical protein